MFIKSAFHYSCIALLISFIALLSTPFITFLMYEKSGFNDEIISFGVTTGVFAAIGMVISFQFAYALYKKNPTDNTEEKL